MAASEVAPLRELAEPVTTAPEADGSLPIVPSPRPRRKVRKGTKSCWECKHRKIKCIFRLPTDKTCMRCARRGVQCVGQEHPEVMTTSLGRSLQMGDRVVRVETLVDQLLREIPAISTTHRPSPSPRNDDQQGNRALDPVTLPAFRPPRCELSPTVLPDVRGPRFQVLAQDPSNSPSRAPHVSIANASEHARLSQALRQHLPSEEDVQMIAKASSSTSSMFYQMHTVPYSALDETRSIDSMFKRPSPEAHPALIARHMLYLATSLQHLHPKFHQEIQGLSKPPHEMRNSLVRIASDMVTSRDELIDNIEGLDCIIIESWYHANNGNLQKALITIRRAITIAQVMGFHRKGNAQCTVISPETQAYPDLMWFRMLAHERYLCLMLGVPQSTLDQSMASDAMLAGDTPMGRLDRIHCVIACQLLERNQTDPKEDDYALTQELDERLQIASRDMPPGWWLTPNLATGAHQPIALFWYMRQLFHQLLHHSLLVHVHLPYMLRSSQGGQQYEYSRVTCVNSSREILSRLIMFHSFNRIAFSCHTIDFFGLMAAITLLIAHIERNQCGLGSRQRHGASMRMTEGLLTHQRPCDRALVEQAQVSMGDACQLTADATNASCSGLLRRLLAVEEEAYNHSMRQDHPGGTTCLLLTNKDETIQLTIPFFGVINITSQVIMPKDTSGECSTAGDPEINTCPIDTFNADDVCGGQTAIQPLFNDNLDFDLNNAAGMSTYQKHYCSENAPRRGYGTPVSVPSNDLTQLSPNIALPSNGGALSAADSQYPSSLFADETRNWTLPSSNGDFLSVLASADQNAHNTGNGPAEWIDVLQPSYYCLTWIKAYEAREAGDKQETLKLVCKATAGFVGTVDLPPVDFISEMVELYPDAKVVLVKRDVTRW
ncbi:hypothetical protein F4860DRAFT_519045 [Xylaria cubensis]|nr:hypothetical protein F4860DRAFT_519045 [Xylaria cubensis]